ncbi:MAG: DUF3221 domain-containing protein [Clostridiales bacterium]|nr:DUF3221 domain-containing protein [Clostridiales bacterium]
MKKQFVIIIVILFIIVGVGSFFGGYFLSKNKYDSNSNSNSDNLAESTTFYATISSINENSIAVSGDENNDVNYRGEFVLGVDKNTSYSWRGTEISLSQLKVGSRISITFSGRILEIYPAIIEDVYKIILLDDEV